VKLLNDPTAIVFTPLAKISLNKKQKKKKKKKERKKKKKHKKI